MQTFNITGKELNISEEDLFREMGYRSSLPEEEIREESRRLIRRVSPCIQPRFGYYRTTGRTEGEVLILDALPFHTGKIINRHLKGSEAFVLFVATAGREFEELQKREKQQGDPLAIYMLDALGSIIAEKTADRVEEQLAREIVSDGWKHTNRFSPGYCGWPLAEQHPLFSLFPRQPPCDIELTNSSLMIPIKSVSGIIGVGKEVKKYSYSCGLCQATDCYKRKK
ncbi:MAG: methionine synthase [Bacteroides sp.]|nr:methionine synthase [Bacteroides sp.]